MAVGGVIYTVGFTIYVIEKPNPFPGVFGFHEIWHVLVVLAALLHYILIYFFVLPAEQGATLGALGERQSPVRTTRLPSGSYRVTTWNVGVWTGSSWVTPKRSRRRSSSPKPGTSSTTVDLPARSGSCHT
jgi:hypothetical protein